MATIVPEPPDDSPAPRRTDVYMTCRRCHCKSPVGTRYDELWTWLEHHPCDGDR